MSFTAFLKKRWVRSIPPIPNMSSVFDSSILSNCLVLKDSSVSPWISVSTSWDCFQFSPSPWSDCPVNPEFDTHAQAHTHFYDSESVCVQHSELSSSCYTIMCCFVYALRLPWTDLPGCILQKLTGASLLILANKQDIKGALQPEELAKVNLSCHLFMEGTSVWYAEFGLKLCTKQGYSLNRFGIVFQILTYNS